MCGLGEGPECSIYSFLRMNRSQFVRLICQHNDYPDRQGLNENFTLNVEICSFYTSHAEPKLMVCDKLQLLKFLM